MRSMHTLDHSDLPAEISGQARVARGHFLARADPLSAMEPGFTHGFTRCRRPFRKERAHLISPQDPPDCRWRLQHAPCGELFLCHQTLREQQFLERRQPDLVITQVSIVRQRLTS